MFEVSASNLWVTLLSTSYILHAGRDFNLRVRMALAPEKSVHLRAHTPRIFELPDMLLV